MLENNNFTNNLTEVLEEKPYKAERFSFSEGFEVDFLNFLNRPYQGVNSLITNGVSNFCVNNRIELVLSFDPRSVDPEVDLGAFMATYIQLHYLENCESIDIGDYFKVPGSLFKGHDYVGIYTTSPCYFPQELPERLKDIDLLWLIPIFQNEYEFIQKCGVNVFEEFLERNDPDLCVFNRMPLDL